MPSDKEAPSSGPFDSHEIAGVFGRAAADYDTVIPFFARFGAKLVDLAALQPGETVLDVGSGRGATLLPAAADVGPEGRVLGVDLSEEMVALLQADIAALRLTNASATRMDAEALEVEPESFDVVLCNFVLHLLPDPEKAAAGFRRVLRPSGRCVAGAPSATGPTWKFLGRIFGTYAPRAVRPLLVPFRAAFDLPATMAAGGLHVDRVVEEEIVFHFADEDAWWAWAWSQGMRDLLEALSPTDLEQCRQDLFSELAALRTPAGIALPQRALFASALRQGDVVNST